MSVDRGVGFGELGEAPSLGFRLLRRDSIGGTKFDAVARADKAAISRLCNHNSNHRQVASFPTDGDNFLPMSYKA